MPNVLKVSKIPCYAQYIGPLHSTLAKKCIVRTPCNRARIFDDLSLIKIIHALRATVDAPRPFIPNCTA